VPNSAFEVIPAIDLLDRRVVRLEQGRRERVTVYSDDPVAFARQFAEAGATRLHVVDLNGAFDGEMSNLDLVAEICRATHMRVELGGGIRSLDGARRVWNSGVEDVILGTRALEDPSLAQALFKTQPDRVIIGIDSRNGVVATRGWVSDAGVQAVNFAAQMAILGCRRIITTDIATDGMLTGPNLEALREMALAVPGVEIIASGGIARLEDIEAILALGLPNITGAITGRAVYDGRLDLARAVRMTASTVRGAATAPGP